MLARTEEAAGWADLEFANAVRALREAYKLPTESLRELSRSPRRGA